MDISEFRFTLSSSYVLFVCEGGAERTVIRKLIESGQLICRSENIIEVTSLRSASAIEQKFLGYDYDKDLIIARILDSKTERFTLGNLYRDRFSVCNIRTSPEIEMLVIINEHQLAAFNKVKSRVKPSQFCIRELGFTNIKKPDFLEAYWSTEALLSAIREYKRIHRASPDEFCLADMLR